MIRFTSKWLMMASVALVTACGAETTVLGPAQPAGQRSAPIIQVREQVRLPAIERVPSAVDQDEFEGPASSQPERKPAGRFSRYAMAAS